MSTPRFEKAIDRYQSLRADPSFPDDHLSSIDLSLPSTSNALTSSRLSHQPHRCCVFFAWFVVCLPFCSGTMLFAISRRFPGPCLNRRAISARRRSASSSQRQQSPTDTKRTTDADPGPFALSVQNLVTRPFVVDIVPCVISLHMLSPRQVL